MMHAIVFAGGTLQAGKAVEAAIARANLIIAADSGALTAFNYGLIPSFIIGDLDSVVIPSQNLEAMGSQVIQVAEEKDETDTELAIQLAVDRGAATVTLLGGLGGTRFDHTMANVCLLAAFEPVALSIVDGTTTIWLLRGPGRTSILGQPRDLLSLLPLTAEAIGVRTQNLYYPLHGETLLFGKPRGVSNVLTHDRAEVSLESGMLLIIHTAIDDPL